MRLAVLFLTICASVLLAAICIESSAQNSVVNSEKLVYSDDRPANFVFLLDVSGSIVSPRTNVRAADGSTTTLFEALRQALKQIVSDQRLVSENSKIAFITFGTEITEKLDWPSQLNEAAQRSLLLSKISSKEELQADKHGDTYMAGGLHAAYARAEKFAEKSQACTSTFIIMLTDGWDEPPASAAYKVQEEASKYLAKQAELKSKLGVNTWQVKVVGLQRMPEKKAGATTAKQLAGMLGGEFIDLSKSESGSVAERIYQALKKTISSLRGQLDLPDANTASGLINFGEIAESAEAEAELKLWNRSCYVEKLEAVSDCSKTQGQKPLARDILKSVKQMAEDGKLPGFKAKGKELQLLSALPEQAVYLKLDKKEILLAPVGHESIDPAEAASVKILARVAPICPPGAYLGFASLSSTAGVPDAIPYIISVPSRLTLEQDALKVQIRKPGFIFDKDTSGELAFRVSAKVASNSRTDFDLVVQAGPAVFKEELSADQKAAEKILASKLINRGEPIELKIESGDSQGSQVKMEVRIPKDTTPGKYEGKIHVKSKEQNDFVSDCSSAYLIEVLPSPWDEMSPLAIPIFGFFVLIAIVSAYMALIGSRERI